MNTRVLVEPEAPTLSHTIDFFDEQFRHQLQAHEFELNPFERLALEYLQGSLLDLGCGLGVLSLEAARRGCRVMAVDGSATAVEGLSRNAKVQGLTVEARQVDLTANSLDSTYDTIVAIGLLMFFPRDRALSLLEEIRQRVVPGGVAVLNVLEQGTTYLKMFETGCYHLFGPDELRDHFSDWEVLVWRHDSFDAPENTTKNFATLIARKPRAGS